MSDALGRVTLPDGRIVSARLIEKLKNPETAVDATLEDVAEVIEPSMGGRRKMRGGETKSGKAVKDLVNGVASAGVSTARTIDDLGAKIISNAPTILTAAVVTKAVNSPTVFANIVSFTREAVTTSIANNTVASWSEYLGAAKQIVSEMGGLGIDLATFTVTSPYFAFVVASSVMKYRASKANKSLTDLIKSDAEAVTSATMRGVTGEIQSFNDAWSKEALKKATDTLRSVGRNVQVTPGESSAAIAQVASPAFGGPIPGVPDAMQPRPGRSGKEKRPSKALDRLAAVSSAKAIAGPKGGRRKTKKSKKVRRATRRRLTFSY
jgi:hypothetical protein